jgi:hypothetical protein
VGGVPLDAHGDFSMAFFSDFMTRGYVGLVDWYTVSVAVIPRAENRRPGARSMGKMG